MALARRSNARFSSSIWPGFVDALTALLLILMFVLSIFMVVQFTLHERITGQDQRLEALGQELAASTDEVSSLTNQLAALSQALGLEQTRSAGLETEVGTLRSTLSDEREEVSRLTAALSVMSRAREASDAEASRLTAALAAMTEGRQASDAEASRLTAALAAMTEARQASDAEAARLSGELQKSLTDAEALDLALAAARSEISEQEQAARLAAARRDALEAMVAGLEADRTAKAARIIELDAAQARTLALVGDLRAEQEAARARITEQEAEAAAALALIESLKAAEAISAEELASLREANAAALADLEKLTAEQALALAAIARVEVERDTLAASDTAQTAEIADLQGKLEVALARAAELGQALTAEEEARLVEVAAAEALRLKLAESTDELDAVALALEQARAEAEQTLTLLAAAEAARKDLSEDALTAAESMDREAALRAVAEQQLTRAEQLTAAEQRKVAALNAQVRELNTQLGALQALLNDARDRDQQAQIQLAELGSQLNQALAQKVSELSRFRSEFFGRMQEVLGGRDGVRVVGDRFVFQSEVLFGSASAELGPAGKTELGKLAEIIREVAATAAPGLNWILRVDGHTDRIPLSGSGVFRDNWELSQARALSVVRYLIEVEGISPNRLAATGFGEYQPLEPGITPEALARNRRIEFKFTER